MVVVDGKMECLILVGWVDVGSARFGMGVQTEFDGNNDTKRVRA